MKCPWCGVWSTVEEVANDKRRSPRATRSTILVPCMRRTRVCGNGHKFMTDEMLIPRFETMHRDTLVMQRAISGVTYSQVAREFKVPLSSVSRIMKRLAPDYDATIVGNAAITGRKKK